MPAGPKTAEAADNWSDEVIERYLAGQSIAVIEAITEQRPSAIYLVLRRNNVVSNWPPVPPQWVSMKHLQYEIRQCRLSLMANEIRLDAELVQLERVNNFDERSKPETARRLTHADVAAARLGATLGQARASLQVLNRALHHAHLGDVRQIVDDQLEERSAQLSTLLNALAEPVDPAAGAHSVAPDPDLRHQHDYRDELERIGVRLNALARESDSQPRSATRSAPG